jgi:hypothetical protein
MNHNDYHGQLYEAFVEWVLKKNTLAHSHDKDLQPAHANQMDNLIAAEYKGENPEVITQLGQVVKDKIQDALLLLYQSEEYEWKKQVILNLIDETRQASSSLQYIQILNQTIDFVHSDRVD